MGQIVGITIQKIGRKFRLAIEYHDTNSVCHYFYTDLTKLKKTAQNDMNSLLGK